ncbi:MAG: carboxypeptidase regulatory-like domain-containing protein, partial [Thermoplasmata archaeon]|nr:carboxypeptidase regulatory-like domain-containing protein [Thermoplasmata archaeon]
IWGINGTWEVVVSYDKPTADGIEEWNGSVTFTVTSAPKVQIKILNPEDKEIKAVPCNLGNPFFVLNFTVINKNHEYLGGSGSEDEMKKAEKNITIYGDALFIGEEGKTLAEYKKICPFAIHYTPPSDGNDGIWSVKIIPLMDLNGGEIKIKVNWENTTKEETIQVGGTKLNGTIVTITPSEFTIDENVTLTVKVTDASGYAYPNANVFLYYFDNVTGSIITDNPINWTMGGGTTSGEYTFLFNVSQQTDNQTAIFGEVKAPRYIIACAGVLNVGCGYAYAVMKPRSDLKVEISRDTFMAGKPYHFWINVSTIDPITGNKTGTPADSGLHVRIYNETGADVTDTIGSLTKSKLDGSASIELSSEYFTKPGTYTIYAYNNTHDSEGFNATIHVIPVEVTCDKSEFIWRVDNNITATFTVTWQGQPVNGTLKLYNITDVGKYNRTWANYTAGGNDTIELEVVNGVATLHDITAEYLPEGKGSMNITFEFKPEESGSAYAKAKGVVLVKVPDATPTPDKVAVGQTATVNVLVTGRGQPLSGVNVTLKGAGINLNATTGSDGIAPFSFLPGSTGKISILIENRSTGVTIEVTAYALEIEIPASVAEGTFTITVKDEKGNPVEGAYVKFTGTGETKTTNSEGKVTFNITIPGTMPYATYKLIATKAGYRSDEETITIANVFNLYITAPSKLSAGQKLTVKVTSDTGPVYGVTVKIKKGEEVIDTKTLTGPEGVTFTIPKVKEKTTFTIIAEKEGFKPATYEITVSPAGIPGFELITLLAAIGIAIILLRKKKQ